MKIKKINYYGLNHDAAIKEFNATKYVNDVPIRHRNDSYPAAVYFSANPDRSKGHKDYVFIFNNGGQMYVSGLDSPDMEQNRYVDGILCHECETTLYSIQRHHCHTCGCLNDAMVDGGTSYLRYGAKDMTKLEQVIVDLLTDEVFDMTGVKL